MNMTTESLKKIIRYRVIVLSLVLGIWLICSVFSLIREGLAIGGVALPMTIAIVVVWVIQIARSYRLLRNEELMNAYTVARNDERNTQIAYKASRTAIVILFCAVPIAICILSVLGMNEAMNAIVSVAGVFAVLYLLCYFYFSKKL